MTKRNEKIEDATIRFGCEEGDRIFKHLLEEYPELDTNDMRRSSIMLSLMTNAAQYLHITGWSERDLIMEVYDHCELARKWLTDDDDDV